DASTEDAEDADGDARGRVAFPEAWDGRASLGLDRLQAAHVRPGTRAPEPEPPGRIPDATESLARRLDRMVLGGRPTLGVVARRGVDQDVAVLRRRHLATGAELLAGLASTAAARAPAADVAQAWHAAAVYERAVGRRLGSARWLAGAPAERGA
ncbi:MAG TPA: hypothetical protein VFO05_09880, partial [Candidatus Limnocylindrales bacterium]|nr:hypothetical protein [Candidatus Limnocylindrales bacterium]